MGRAHGATRGLALGMLTLRPYQADAVEALLAHPASEPRGALFVGGVGVGKTEIALTAAARVLDRGGRVVWVVHRTSLLEQPYQRLLRYWPKHAFRAGFVQAARDAVDARCIFASIHTITRAKRLASLLRHGHPDLVVVDEVHHGTSASYAPVLEAFRSPRTQFIGLTATPDREDGASLADQWQIVASLDMVAAIDAGWNTIPYVSRYRMPSEIEQSVNEGRIDKEDLAQTNRDLMDHVVRHTVEAMCAPTITGSRLPWRDDLQTFDPRSLQWMVFTATVAQAKATAAALNARGWVARSISGDPNHTNPDQQRLLLTEYNARRVQVLCNANLLTEGVDAPVTGGVLYARRTASRPLFVQILGRGLRLDDPAWPRATAHEMNRIDPRYRGRLHCLAVDLVGCSDEHSIVSAPVLVGDACPHAGLRPTSSGGAMCPACEKKWACWASLQRGRDGQHAFVPDPQDEYRPKCRWCERPQCADSETGRHVWDPAPEHKFKCAHCPAEYTDPLAALLKGRAAVAAADRRFVDGDALSPGEVALVRVSTDPEAWAVGLDAQGFLLIVGSREGRGWWDVRWIRPGEEIAVGPGGYDTRHAWGVAQDVIRQTARRARDARKGGEVWGGLDEAGRDRLIERAEQVLGVSHAA